MDTLLRKQFSMLVSVSIIIFISALVVFSIFNTEKPTGNATVIAKTIDDASIGETPLQTTTSSGVSSVQSGAAVTGAIVKKSYLYAGTLVGSASSDETGLSFYIQDHLGNNMKVIKGVLATQTNKYYAFGETSTTGTDGNAFKYNSKEFDPETNLYYYGARYYNPSIGRFLQSDMLSGNLKDPLSFNKYTYVKNNPLKYIDPTGNEAAQFEIYNINGQRVQDKTTKASTSNLASGVYFCVVYDKDGNKLKVDKIVVVDGAVAGSTAKTSDGKMATRTGATELSYDTDTFFNKPKDAAGKQDPKDRSGDDPDVYNNFQGAPLNPGEQGLRWTNPGDDGMKGQAARYEIRYRPADPNTPFNWDTATPAAGGTGTPGAAGTKSSVILTGLPSGRLEYQIRVYDEAGNHGDSNIASVVTAGTLTPPSGLGGGS
jgi:RHS repeat-associated protein